MTEKTERLQPSDLKAKHPSKLICGMCDKPFIKSQTIAELNWGHKFHSECSKLWMLNQKPCPFCGGNKKTTTRFKSTTESDYLWI